MFAESFGKSIPDVVVCLSWDFEWFTSSSPVASLLEFPSSNVNTVNGYFIESQQTVRYFNETFDWERLECPFRTTEVLRRSITSLEEVAIELCPAFRVTLSDIFRRWYEASESKRLKRASCWHRHKQTPLQALSIKKVLSTTKSDRKRVSLARDSDSRKEW